MMQSQAGQPQNRLLATLPPEIFARLSPQLEPITMRRKMVLVQASELTPYVYFPDNGLISFIKVMDDGRTAELGSVGPEGMIGVPALLGMTQPSFEGVVQVNGLARRISTAFLRAEVDQSPQLRELVLRYLSFRISQLAQTSACNRLHTLHQRCCRWLLTAHDGAQTTTFTLTHEFLALMMGVNRPHLSETLSALQKARVINYRYASVTIVNRRELEKGSCECYETLQHEASQICLPGT